MQDKRERNQSAKGAWRAIALSSIVTILCGCAQPQAPHALATAAARPSSGTIATVNGVAIDRGQLDEALRETAQPDSPESRAIATKGLVIRELIRQAAEAQGLGNAPAVQAAEHKARVDAENRLYVAEHAPQRKATEAQIRARYDAIVGEMGPEEYKARVIVLPDDASAQDLLARLRRGEPFDAFVKGEMWVPGPLKTGSLPWLSFKTPPRPGHTLGLPIEVARAISEMSVGETSAVPLVLGAQRVFVHLDAERPARIPRFGDVRDGLRQMIETQAQSDAFNGLVDALARNARISP